MPVSSMQEAMSDVLWFKSSRVHSLPMSESKFQSPTESTE